MDKKMTAAEFLAAHAGIVSTALQTYAETMRAEAANAAGAWRAVKDDPDKRRTQDRSLITTQGLRQASEIFTVSAGRAERANRALRELTENDAHLDADATADTVEDLMYGLRGNPWGTE